MPSNLPTGLDLSSRTTSFGDAGYASVLEFPLYVFLVEAYENPTTEGLEQRTTSLVLDGDS